MKICRRLKKRSLLEVNEHFSDKQSFEDDPLSQPKNLICCQKALDVVAGRRPSKRSILDVCEHFKDKPDAADDALSQQINIC